MNSFLTSGVVSALANHWLRLDPGIRGALWMLAASLFLSAMAATLKIASQSMSVWEMLVIRTAIALLLLFPAIASGKFRAVRTRRPFAHAARGTMGALAFALFFLAVTHIELTLAVTLGFTRNLFILILAALFLGEALKVFRSAATLAGFMGVLVCVQPTGSHFDPWSLAAIGFALVAAGVTVMVKRLSHTESPLTIIFYTYVSMGAVALIPAILDWTHPSIHDLFMVLLVAIFSTLGQTCMVHSLRTTEATAVTPFEYSRILYALVFGYMLFGETPPLSTFVGGAIIMVSTLSIAYHDRRRKSGNQTGAGR